MKLERVLILLVSVFSTSLVAQVGTDSVGVLTSKNYAVDGSGKLTYRYGKKIGDDPVFKDTVKVDSEVDYNFIDKKLNSGFEVKPIKAPKLNMLEPLQKIYKGYTAIGVNDFKTPPYFDFNYSTIRNRHYNAGFGMNHISQHQDINDAEEGRYTNSNVSVFGKKFYKHKTWYSSADYNYNTFRFYGFNPDDVSDINEDEIANGYSVLKAQTGLKSNVKGKKKTGYDVKLNYDQLIESRFAVVEHKVGLESNINWFVKTKPVDFIADIDLGASYLNSGRVLGDHSSMLFDLAFTATKKSKKYDVVIGVKSFFQTSQERQIWAFPFFEADYSVVKDVLHVYGRVTTDYNRNSYLDYIVQNPFIRNQEDVITSITKQDIMAGLKGAFNSKSSFNLGIRYKNHSNLPLYYNEGNQYYNKFRLIADEVEHRQAFAEFVWDGKKLDFSAKGEYNIYDVYKNEAFHLPNLYAELGASYNLQDKIEVATQVFMYGNQLALDHFNSEGRAVTKDLDAFVDFNIDLKYHYTKRLGAFFKVNNILNTKQAQWDQYANYGMNFLFGVDYSF